MKSLVIGGTGFISGRLVAMLAGAGHAVTTLTRGIAPAPNHDTPVRMVRGERSDEALLRRLAGEDWDVVFDMIAYEPDESRLVGEAFAGSTGRLVHCSTISVYMVSDRVQCPVTEDQDQAPLMPHFPRNPFGMDYGIRKRQCEEVLWSMHARGELEVTMLRPTYVCGPRDPVRRDWFWIERILDGGPLLVPGSGDHAFQSVFVDDVARAFLTASSLPSAAGRAYNVAGREIFSLNEYLRALAEMLGREADLVHVPQHTFDAWQFSTADGVDVFPFNTRRTAVFSLDRTGTELGLALTPFQEWMPSTIGWFVGRGKPSPGYEHRRDEIALARSLRATATGPVS
jgi:nucleoside-diphosphate-sugar epimerase